MNPCDYKYNSMTETVTVADGYNGDTVELDATNVLDTCGTSVKLGVAGKPWLTRWVALSDYYKAVQAI